MQSFVFLTCFFFSKIIEEKHFGKGSVKFLLPDLKRFKTVVKNVLGATTSNRQNSSYIIVILTNAVVRGIRSPPEVPITILTLPSSSITIVGALDERGLFLGPGTFTLGSVMFSFSRYKFMVKSTITLLNIMPVVFDRNFAPNLKKRILNLETSSLVNWY